VAIIGSTEHGACDPIVEISTARTEFQARGLSFAIHCDATWGGYFTSMIREAPTVPGKPELSYVPPMPLQPYTVAQLKKLCHPDSIIIDPHK
jgi:glutamate/tyrosine decarboxylase-like PLP-dependent enzyme